MSITVNYSAIDGFRQSRSFKTINGARSFAHHWIGACPSVGVGYAVSDDGIGKITVKGCTLADLFPATEAGYPGDEIDQRLAADEDARRARLSIEDIFADFIAQERGIPLDM